MPGSSAARGKIAIGQRWQSLSSSGGKTSSSQGRARYSSRRRGSSIPERPIGSPDQPGRPPDDRAPTKRGYGSRSRVASPSRTMACSGRPRARATARVGGKGGVADRQGRRVGLATSGRCPKVRRNAHAASWRTPMAALWQCPRRRARRHDGRFIVWTGNAVSGSALVCWRHLPQRRGRWRMPPTDVGTPDRSVPLTQAPTWPPHVCGPVRCEPDRQISQRPLRSAAAASAAMRHSPRQRSPIRAHAPCRHTIA